MSRRAELTSGRVKTARVPSPLPGAVRRPFLLVAFGAAVGALFVATAPVTRTLILGWLPDSWSVDSRLDAATRRANRDRMTRLFLAFHNVALLEAIPSGQTMKVTTPETDTVIYKEVERGLSLGDSISDAYLDWLDPSIKPHFRNELLLGARVYVNGLQKHDAATQLAGLRFIDEWQNFWRGRVAEVSSRALSD